MQKFNGFKKNVHLFALITLVAYLTIHHNACSEVSFEERPDSLGSTSATPTIIINGGATYTQLELVNLALHSPNSAEMLISNVEDCSLGQWEPLTTSKTWSLSNLNAKAQVFVKYRSEDFVETDCISDDIIHDDIPPAVTYLDVPGQFTNQDTYTVPFAVVDEGSGIQDIYCQAGLGAPSQSCADAFTYANLQEGGQNLQVRASDKAGNFSLPVPFPFTVDQTPPVPIIVSGPAAITNLSEANIQFSASDNISGVMLHECFNKHETDTAMVYAPCETTMNYTDLIEGTYQFYVRSVDYAGNVSDPVTHTWKIDKTAPTVVITKGPNPYVNVGDANFEFNGVDIVSYECKVDDAVSYVACASPHDITGLVEGRHTFYVRGSDAAGNVSADAAYNWVVDLTAPTVMIVSGPDNPTKSTSATFTFSGEDALSGLDRYECQIDGGAYVACSSGVTYDNLAEGAHVFNVKSYDVAGNASAPATYNWVVDLTPPVVTLISGPDPLTADRNALFEFSATDNISQNLATFCMLTGDLDYAPCTSPHALSDLADGNYNFYIIARDEVGNESDPVIVNWTVDGTPPVITFVIYPQLPVVLGDPVNIVFTIDDPGSGVQSYSCELDGQDTQTCMAGEENLFMDLALGDHSFSVTATDALGNSGTEMISFSVVIDGVNVTQNYAASGTNKVDILFTIDDSGSMNEDRFKLADRVAGFIDNLSTIDWHIGVTTADVSSDGLTGRMAPLDGLANEFVLTSMMDPTLAQTVLGNTINRQEKGSGPDQCIYSTYLLVDAYQNMNTSNDNVRQFIRPDSHMAVLCFSDKDERMNRGERNEPQTLLDKIDLHWPDKNLLWSNIAIKPGDSQCLQQQLDYSKGPAYAHKYNEFSELTGGISGSICEPDYADQLQDLADRATALPRSVILDCPPLDADGNGTIDVTISFRATGTNDYLPYSDTYTIDQRRLTFANDMAAGDYRFEYLCTQAAN